MSTQAAEQREKAAEQYGLAARHYQEAAAHSKAGNHEKAAHHAHTAQSDSSNVHVHENFLLSASTTHPRGGTQGLDVPRCPGFNGDPSCPAPWRGIRLRETDPIRERFRKLAYTTAEAVGSPWAFLACVVVVLVWGLTGPYFHFSDTWQLVINTGTSLVTFLVVFLIQGAQNRDARAVHLKLDELLRAVEQARTSLVALESRTDAELDQLQNEFQHLRGTQGERLERCPDVPACDASAASPTL